MIHLISRHGPTPITSAEGAPEEEKWRYSNEGRAARLAELLRAEDREFQALGHLASVLELPAEAQVSLWDAQNSALAKVKEVQDNSALGLSERRRRVAEARARLEQDAASLLGEPRNFDAWQRSRRDWIRDHFSVPDPDPVELLR